MKTQIIFIPLIFTTLLAIGQIENNVLNTCEIVYTELKFDTSERTFATDFSSVKVIDARDDTSEIGYNSYDETGRKLPEIFSVHPSVKNGIELWVSKYLQLNANNTTLEKSLLIVIKKLWLSPAALPATSIETDKEVQANQGLDAGLVTELEFYLQKDSLCYPIYKIDSVFAYAEKLPKYAGHYFTESLKASLKKLFRINFENVVNKGRKLSLSEIEANNYKSFAAIPILSSDLYKKGVYKTFAEFKANAPSVTEYELRQGKWGDVLYVKENNTEAPSRNAWGFCDGTNIYINSGDKYSKLVRRQNTFYFQGIKGIKKEAKHDLMYTSLLNLATDTGRKYTKYSKEIKYFKVDMKTGESY